MDKEVQLYRIAFTTHLVSFIKQAVVGIIVSSYSFYTKSIYNNVKNNDEIFKIFKNEEFIFENIIEYMNTNWKNMNTNGDKYIVDKFECLIKFGRFKHNSCIFLFVWDIIKDVVRYCLQILEIPNFENIEILRKTLNDIVDSKLSKIVDELIFDDFNCENECVPILYKEGQNIITNNIK